MSVRIIAGSCKGRRLKVPPSPGVRPTGDRARESLFNVLAPRLPGARFLDAFAGSGAVGIEALSRGASAAVFVERDARVAVILAENAAHCGVDGAAEILQAPWKAAVRLLARRGERRDACQDTHREAQRDAHRAARFDVAFFDPPYDWSHTGTLLEDLAAGDILSQEGVAVIEHRTGSEPEETRGWKRARVLAVGDTSFSFFGILADS